MLLTAQGDSGEGELLYPFVWEEAERATPTS